MAIIEVDRADLEKLIGKKLTIKDIEENIPVFGCPLEKIDGNKLYYEIFPNRPDMLSVEGFARALGMFLFSKNIPEYKVRTPKIKLSVDSSVKSVRPYVVAAVIRNVKLTEASVASLMQVQEKIHDTLGRRRKKVAIGVHDFNKVEPPFVYRAVAPDSIRFVPLAMDREMSLNDICEKHPKGIDYVRILKGHKLWPIILDKNDNVLSFPPIINGELTKVTEKTRNLFIDITGTSESAVNQALNIIVTSLADRGFEIEAVDVSGKVTPDLKPSSLKVNVDYVNKLLDMDMTYAEMDKIIRKTGLYVSGKSVVIPAYRTDIMHEIDIVEDVAIGHGYQKFEPKIPKVPTIAKRLNSNELSLHVKCVMAGMGFQEVVSSLLSHEKTEFHCMNIPEKDACQLLNSVSSEFSLCRLSVLPSLIKVLSENQHREYPQNIFEIGDVARPDDKSETGAQISRKVACAMANSRISYEEISSVLTAMLSELGVEFKLIPSKHPSFIDGRVAEIIIKEKSSGFVGEINPLVLNNFSMSKPAAAFEIEFYLL